jgi:hypothetical protein
MWRRAVLAVLAVVVIGLSLPAVAGAEGSTCGTGTTTTDGCAYGFLSPDGVLGEEQAFTVPAGITSIQVTAVGAPGAAFASLIVPPPPPYGAVVSATISVTPGQTLYVEVGGAGGIGPYEGGTDDIAPFNGGGYSVYSSGGGASDVQTQSVGTISDDQPNGSDWTSALGSRLLVAGGGGAGDEGGAGGDAGQAGQPGQAGAGIVFDPVTDRYDGVGLPAPQGGLPGQDLTSSTGDGQGQDGLPGYYYGGSGGGGYTGGGSGGAASEVGNAFTTAGGGGGGSSYANGQEIAGTPATTTTPSVLITFTASPPATTPEAPAVLLLPAAGLALFGGVYGFRRRAFGTAGS